MSDDSTLVYGLHPIRSEMLADLLTDPTLAPWAESAKAAIEVMIESDIETFLLYAFSRRPADSKALCQSLTAFQPTQWSTIAGITRSLIWIGMREYITLNGELILDVFKEMGKGWLFGLDSDIADVSPGSASSIWATMSSMIPEEGKHRLKQLRSRQTDKTQVFLLAKGWLAERTCPPHEPQTDDDWAGMAESLFWLARFQLSWPLSEWLAEIPFDAAIGILSLELLADVVLGISLGFPEFFETWMIENRSRIVVRFREATRTIALEDDGRKITAHFLIELESSEDSETIIDRRVQASKDRLHEKAISRLSLMRRLFPNRQLYACQGYGHRILPENDPLYDSTQKTGVDRKDFPPVWLTRINSLFRGLAEREFRPKTWHEYVQILASLRRDVLVVISQLIDGLERYFISPNSFQLIGIGTAIDPNLWDSCADRFRHWPLLPACALDEWGLVDESTSNTANLDVKERISLAGRKGLVMQTLRPFLEAFSDYDNHLSNFFKQAIPVIALSPVGKVYKNAKTRTKKLAVAREQHGIQKNVWPLSTLNLAEVVKAVPRMQREFRKLLNQFFSEGELLQLEQEEKWLYRNAWNLRYIFETRSECVFRKRETVTTQVVELDNQMRLRFRKEIGKLTDDNARFRIESETLLWEDRPALWVTIDGKNAIETYNAVDKILPALNKAIKIATDFPLGRYLIDFQWPFAVVIPLVKGRSLSGTAWSWNLQTLLMNGELKWWHFMHHAIPNEAMSAFGITVWTDPRLDPATEFLKSVGQLSLWASHMADFEKFPVLDDSGVAQLQDYLSVVGKRLSRIFQIVLDKENEIFLAFNRLSPDDQMRRVNLLGAMQLFVKLHTAILPTDDFNEKIKMDLPKITEWANRLKKAQENAWLIYLLLISDLIETTE